MLGDMNESVYEIPFDKLKKGHKVVIYGAGRVGEYLYDKIQSIHGLELVAVVDQNPEGKLLGKNVLIFPPEELIHLEFDYVIVAIESQKNAEKIIANLELLGISKRKIIWNGSHEDSDFVSNSFEFIKFLERNIHFYSKKIFLFMLPEHGNVGDYAIGVAETKFFAKYFPEMELVSVTTTEWMHAANHIIPYVKKDDLICLNGGGYLGNLWEGDSDVYRSIIEAFPYNVKILMPNTLSFKDNIDEKNEAFLEEASFFRKRDNCHVFFRDKKSYFLGREFGFNCCLFPDMAFYLDGIERDSVKNGNKILLCMRNDREQIADIRNQIYNVLSHVGYEVDEFDINLGRYVSWDNAEEVVTEICRNLQQYELVITDRLHGMVLSIVSNVPCLAFDNKTHKVSGVYEWVSGSGYAKLLETSDTSRIDVVVKETIENQDANDYKPLVDEFDKMANFIRKIIKDN